MIITTLYDIGDRVEHVTGEDGRVGVIVAFTLRGITPTKSSGHQPLSRLGTTTSSLFPPSNVHPSASPPETIMSNPHNHELNPNNPLVRQAHSQWHAICAILMAKLGITDIEITEEDVARLQDGQCIVLDNRNQQLNLRIVTEAEAQRLAKENGGGFSAS